MKNKITQLEVYKSIRKTWAVKPITRIQKNGKKKSRAKIKSEGLKNKYF